MQSDVEDVAQFEGIKAVFDLAILFEKKKEEGRNNLQVNLVFGTW